MKRLKSERHHRWPECVSRHWAAEDGTTGWLKPDGSCLRIPPGNLGVIGNGHIIKLGAAGEPSPWDQTFERVFDKADTHFPHLIEWLQEFPRKVVDGERDLRGRFIPQTSTDDQLALMTECAVSLAVRGPMNREASVAVAEHVRGPIPTAERNVLIGLNMRNSHRLIADSVGSRGKFVAVYSQGREFIFGDGFFHNVGNAQMAPHNPKMLVPITPHIAILVCRPSSYTVEPKMFTLVLDDQEVDICNHAVQVYSKSAIYFKSKVPALSEDYRCGRHLRFSHPGNPIDSLIESIPGVSPRNQSFDAIFQARSETT